MGHEELVGSLRREADEQAGSIWDEAEKEAGKAREEARLESRSLREKFDKELAVMIREEDEVILKEARNKARGIMLSAERALSGRLFSIALSCLEELRSEGSKAVFMSLYKELPAAKWEYVEVNPGDMEYASEVSPGASIRPDDNISGGMRVMSGRICITNTLEKRLERSWEDILPHLIRDVYIEIS